MKYMTLLAAVAAIMAPVAAHAEKGDVQFKVLGTLVLPDGKATEFKFDALNLPAGSQTKATDNFTPTVAIEYFVADNVSLETIAGVTRHDVVGRGALAGTGLVSNADIVPATLTLKYHFGDEKGFKPYIGAGPSYFIFINEKSGRTTTALGATRQKLDDKVGFALQTGFDLAVNDKGLGITVDAKRYFLRTDSHWYTGSTEILNLRHKIDPWVISAGLAYRF